MKKNNLLGSALLCFAALLWGLAFVVQNKAASKIPPFAFNSLRSFIGAIFLFLLMTVFYFVLKAKGSALKDDFAIIPKNIDKKTLITGSIVCGVALAVSTNFQQFGIAAYPSFVPTEARSGFLTALYVIIVPMLSVFIKKRVPVIVWCSAIVALGGFYMLCLFEGFGSFYLADLYVLGCTFTFSLHIIVIDKYCGPIGAVRLSALQFLVAGIISGVFSLIFELSTLSLSSILSAVPEILYMGIVSSGIAYTLQVIGQKYAEPAIASLSMSLESVFAALGGWLITGNVLKSNEIVGCALVFAAIILAQTPEIFKKEKTA